jgi:hypothetical protein
MIVWGGLNSGTYLNTGARYNRAANAWTATTTTGAPAGRYYHTAVWTGSTMVVWGGNFFNGSSFVDLNTGGRYDPGSDSWAPTTGYRAPIARSLHTAVWTGNEMFIFGGALGSSSLNTLYAMPRPRRCISIKSPRHGGSAICTRKIKLDTGP